MADQRAWRNDKVRDLRKGHGHKPAGMASRPRAIALDHARHIAEGWADYLDVLDERAIASDGLDRKEKRKTRTYTSETRPKEAHAMTTHSDTHVRSKGGPPASTVTLPTGSTKARHPWRTDVRIQPAQTLAPDPDAKALSEEDRELLEREPVNPTTRKAAPIAPPETGWTIDDLLDEARLVRAGC